VIAVTADSPSLPSGELSAARSLAGSLGARHVVIETDEIALDAYRANPVDRCYYCKTTLYARMRPLLAEHGMAAMVNGANADDLGDHRPGLHAADEHDVVSPLALAGLTKADVRALSRRLGLATHDKPAGPCLSSRIPYGQPVTREKLAMIDQAEAVLRSFGFPECRVRHHENLARIEVPPETFARLIEPETAGRVVERLRELGYAYVTMDLQGFRSGSLNEVISLGIPRPARRTSIHGRNDG